MGAAAIEVTGITQTRGLLRRFEPDLLKQLDSRLNAATRAIKAGAQASFERTGASGTAYRVRTRNRASGFSKSVTTVAGSSPHWGDSPGQLAAIFEFANGVRDAKPENVARTKSLIATLNRKYGTPGRFLWQTWDEIGDATLAEVDATVKAVEAEYTARLRA